MFIAVLEPPAKRNATYVPGIAAGESASDERGWRRLRLVGRLGGSQTTREF